MTDTKSDSKHEDDDERFEISRERVDTEIRKYGSSQLRIGLEELEKWKIAMKGLDIEITNPLHLFNGFRSYPNGESYEYYHTVPAYKEHTGKCHFQINNDGAVIYDDTIGYNRDPHHLYYYMSDIQIEDLQHDKTRLCKHCTSVLLILRPKKSI